jgi:signal transduction histidine kinase
MNLTLPMFPIYFVDILGSFLSLLVGIVCVFSSRKLTRKDPTNALWVYLFWVSLAIAVFMFSRSFGHFLKYVLIISGHPALWKTLSPISGAVNSMTLVIVGTLVLYYERVKKSYQSLREERDRIRTAETRLEESHREIGRLIDQVRSRGDLTVRYCNPDPIKCWEIKECKHEDCPAYGTDHLRCWHLGGESCCTIRKRGERCGCEACEIYNAAHRDPIQKIGERFNDMMDILEKQASQLKRVNEQLRDEDLRKSKFLEIVAHDLRTPLTSILSYADLLLRYKSEPEETRDEFLRTIIHESQRLSDLITDYLDLSKIESGLMEYRFGILNFRKVIDHAVLVYSGVCLQKNIEIHTEGVPADLAVQGDKKRLIQVMSNLLSNAVKFTPPHGRVDLRAGFSEDGTELRISIEDTGPGIPVTHLDEIFKKFSQLHEGEIHEIVGSGLGLSICKEIVTKHSGRIWAENRSHGGTCFHVVLPVFERDKETPPEIVSAPPGTPS